MKLDQTLLKFLGFNATGDLGPWTFYTSKRAGLVWFIKAPPLEPPSPLQVHQRNKFRLTGYLWRALSPEQQADWSLAQARANLAITGYNLFTYYVTTGDAPAIVTVERQTGLDLIPLQRSP